MAIKPARLTLVGRACINLYSCPCVRAKPACWRQVSLGNDRNKSLQTGLSLHGIFETDVNSVDYFSPLFICLVFFPSGK